MDADVRSRVDAEESAAPSTISLDVAMALVSRVTERRATIPILSNAMIESDGKTLHLTATDLDNEVSAVVPCKAPKFSTTAEGGILRDILARVGTEGIHVEGQKLIVGAGPTFTLDTSPADEFPRVKAGEIKNSFELPAAQLLADLDAIAPAMSSEETRYYLIGVCVDVRDDGKLAFAATDGHRLHILRRDVPDGAKGLPDSIIAKKAVRIIQAALRAMPNVTTVQFHFERRKVRVDIGPVTITAKLIDGTFPDVRRVIPTDPNGKITASADTLLAYAKAAQLLGTEKSKALKFDLKAGVVSSKQLGIGEMTAALPGTCEGQLPGSIGFNAECFAQAVERFQGSDVSVIMVDEVAPTIITSADSPLLVVLMPMRL